MKLSIDKKGIVRDATLRVFPRCQTSISKPAKGEGKLKISADILRRGVRHLNVLLPVKSNNYKTIEIWCDLPGCDKC